MIEPRPVESLGRRGLPMAQAKWLAPIVVLGVPVAQMGLGPSWMYTPPSIDPWVYHGYFLHLQHHAIAFNGTYYGTRLAWILPGYLAHHFFTPLVANAILRLFLYWTAVVSAFLLVRRSYGERSALITCLLLCGFEGFLESIGWDYVDGAGIAYGLLCVEELAAAATGFNEKSPAAVWRSIFAGAAFAAAVHSNVFLLGFTPMVALFFLARTGWRGVVLAIPAGTGFGALTAVLGCISIRLGGRFLFFMPSVRIGPALLKRNAWYVNGLEWTAHAWWLVIPSAICLLALALVIKSVMRRRAGVRDADYAARVGDATSFLVAIAMFVVLAVLQNPVLQLPYYTSYLTIFVVVMTGAFIGRRFEAWKMPHFLGLAAACTCLSLVVGSGLASRMVYFSAILPWRFLIRDGVPPVTLGLIFATGMLLSDWIKQRVVATVIASTCVSALLLHIGMATRHGARDLYLDVSRTSRSLGELTAANPLWFLYNEPSDFDGRCQSIAATYLWGYRILSTHLPEIKKSSLQTIFPGNYVAVMDRQPSVLTEALTDLEHNGLTLGPVQILTSPTTRSNYVVDLVQVTSVAAPSEPKLAALPARRLTGVVTVLKYHLVELQHAVHTVYGHLSSSAGRDLPPGVFALTDARDHFATEFRSLAQEGSAPITALQVSVSDSSAGAQFGPSIMIVQDEEYRTIYASNAVPTGQKLIVVALPARTHAIRVAFLGNPKGFIRLPDSIEVDGITEK